MKFPVWCFTFLFEKGLHFDATRASLMHLKWNMFAVVFSSCGTKSPSLKTFHFGDFEAGRPKVTPSRVALANVNV